MKRERWDTCGVPSFEKVPCLRVCTILPLGSSCTIMRPSMPEHTIKSFVSATQTDPHDGKQGASSAQSHAAAVSRGSFTSAPRSRNCTTASSAYARVRLEMYAESTV